MRIRLHLVALTLAVSICCGCASVQSRFVNVSLTKTPRRLYPKLGGTIDVSVPEQTVCVVRAKYLPAKYEDALLGKKEASAQSAKTTQLILGAGAHQLNIEAYDALGADVTSRQSKCRLIFRLKKHDKRGSHAIGVNLPICPTDLKAVPSGGDGKAADLLCLGVIPRIRSIDSETTSVTHEAHSIRILSFDLYSLSMFENGFRVGDIITKEGPEGKLSEEEKKFLKELDWSREGGAK